ncbi:hypothetical protein [Flavobacterium alkalisoli]|uniref:hypothetical protein n=1 Tax=Flavobacterium alkalisoli TaxID=2602769 RepID=UPI003A95CBE8
MKPSIILFLLLAFSCVNPANEFDNKLIKRIANEDINIDIPSQYSQFDFYIKCENGDVAQVGINLLRFMYKENKMDISFEEFITTVLNHQQTFAESKYIDCFSLDKEISKQYHSQDFKSFLAIYFEKSHDSFRLKKSLSENKLETLFYYCYLNNYLSSFDDPSGFHYVTKTSNLY